MNDDSAESETFKRGLFNIRSRTQRATMNLYRIGAGAVMMHSSLSVRPRITTIKSPYYIHVNKTFVGAKNPPDYKMSRTLTESKHARSQTPVPISNSPTNSHTNQPASQPLKLLYFVSQLIK